MTCSDCEINRSHIETIRAICADRANDPVQHPHYRAYWRGGADVTIGILEYLRQYASRQ